jgi:hypothetical protein
MLEISKMYEGDNNFILESYSTNFVILMVFF